MSKKQSKQKGAKHPPVGEPPNPAAEAPKADEAAANETPASISRKDYKAQLHLLQVELVKL